MFKINQKIYLYFDFSIGSIEYTYIDNLVNGNHIIRSEKTGSTQKIDSKRLQEYSETPEEAEAKFFKNILSHKLSEFSKLKKDLAKLESEIQDIQDLMQDSLENFPDLYI